jgi:hypothetical protein
MKNLRQYVIVGAIAFAVASVAAAVPAIGAGSQPKVPVIKTKLVAGPVDLPTTDGVIASLSLPAGKWAVSARADLTRNGPGLYAFCKLKLTSREVSGAEEIPSPAVYGQMNLMVSNTTSATADVQLICNDVSIASDIEADNIVITAIKAAKLSIT